MAIKAIIIANVIFTLVKANECKVTMSNLRNY